MSKARVILFKPDGKYYTEEYWAIPTHQNVIDAKGRGDAYASGGLMTPDSMIYSPDFRRIGGGPVLVPTQEPWGYPHLFPGVNR